MPFVPSRFLGSGGGAAPTVVGSEVAETAAVPFPSESGPIVAAAGDIRWRRQEEEAPQAGAGRGITFPENCVRPLKN